MPVPGAAVSPGNRIWSLVTAPALTAIAGLGLGVLVPSVMSLAVTVALPAVLSVRLKTFDPRLKTAFAGKAAFVSLEVMPTASATLVTTFQLASTALTVTLKAVPAVRAVGVPVLPRLVPGAAVSPGTSNCSFVNAPELTGMAELVLAVLLPSVTSVAVTVWLPPVMRVTLEVCVPLANAPLGGPAMAGSLEVKLTVSVTVLTKFQKASTALTVTLKAIPAVWAFGVPVLPELVPGAVVSPGTNT